MEEKVWEKLDDESVQSEVMRNLFKDWCKKNNIKDEQVNDLLEASFQRAYTLRDRINNLKRDIFEKFEDINRKLEDNSSSVQKIQEDIGKLQKETQNKLIDPDVLEELNAIIPTIIPPRAKDAPTWNHHLNKILSGFTPGLYSIYSSEVMIKS